MIDTFRPLIDAAKGVDLTDPAAAVAELERRLDPTSESAQKVARELEALLEDGQICARGELPVRYGRVAKAGDETSGFSIDTVLMTGPGPRHRHPQGEVNFCIALEGEPTFDGQGPGWVVMPKESVHVPTVAGGKMLIVYLLPQGEIEFMQG